MTLHARADIPRLLGVSTGYDTPGFASICAMTPAASAIWRDTDNTAKQCMSTALRLPKKCSLGYSLFWSRKCTTHTPYDGRAFLECVNCVHMLFEAISIILVMATHNCMEINQIDEPQFFEYKSEHVKPEDRGGGCVCVCMEEVMVQNLAEPLTCRSLRKNLWTPHITAHLRHPLWRHEARRLDDGHSGVGESVDQVRLRFDVDNRLFVLQSVARTHIDNFDGTRQITLNNKKTDSALERFINFKPEIMCVSHRTEQKWVLL